MKRLCFAQPYGPSNYLTEEQRDTSKKGEGRCQKSPGVFDVRFVCPIRTADSYGTACSLIVLLVVRYVATFFIVLLTTEQRR